MSLIWALQAWCEDPGHQWRSWVSHLVMVVAIAVPFTIELGVFYWFMREVEQTLKKIRESGWRSVDWRDAVMDVVVMMFGVPVFALLFGLR